MGFADFLGGGEATPPTEAQGQVTAPEQQPAPQAAPAQPGIFDKLRTDPALAQAAMMMGARLMQGPKQGQDAIGSMGDAMMIGTHTYAMGKQNELENQRAGERAQAQNELTRAQTESTQATTEGKGIENAENKTLSADRVKSFRLKLDALARMDNVEKARAGYDKLKAQFLTLAAQDSSGQMERIWMSELQNPMLESEAKRGLIGAQTNQANAAAENYHASANYNQARTDDPEKFARAGAVGAGVQSREQIKQLIKNANPGISEAELAQAVLDYDHTAKRKATGDAFGSFLQSNPKYDMSTPKGVEAAKAAFQNYLKVVDDLSGGGKAKPAPQPTGVTPAAGNKTAPVEITTEAEWQKLAPGTPYIYNKRQGIR